VPGFDHIDYYLVVDPRPDGDKIGEFAGVAFAEAVIDAFGRRFVYKGLASRTRRGTYDLDAIGRGEFIVEPGLLYCIDRGTNSGNRRAQTIRLAILFLIGSAVPIGLLFVT
jgi:hypothetical protein